MKYKVFKNVSQVELAGIRPGEVGSLRVNPDGKLAGKAARQHLRDGGLIETKIMRTDRKVKGDKDGSS